MGLINVNKIGTQQADRVGQRSHCRDPNAQKNCSEQTKASQRCRPNRPELFSLLFVLLVRERPALVMNHWGESEIAVDVKKLLGAVSDHSRDGRLVKMV